MEGISSAVTHRGAVGSTPGFVEAPSFTGRTATALPAPPFSCIDVAICRASEKKKTSLSLVLMQTGVFPRAAQSAFSIGVHPAEEALEFVSFVCIVKSLGRFLLVDVD